MSSTFLRSATAAAAVAACLGASAPASAQLALTAQAVSFGFTLSTFATLNPGATGFGPFGVAVSGSNVIVSNYANSTLYSFADVDGQTTATALNSLPSNSGTAAYATVNGTAYGIQNAQFVQFKSDGSIDHVLSGVTPGPYLGMWGNATNGHIISTSSSGLLDIDPAANGGTGGFRVIAPVFGDGVSVSPDGKTAFLETGGGFTTYDIATGAVGYTVGGIGGADGTGVISSKNSLNGDVIVNTNYGEVYLYDPTALTTTLLATGGTRGDYVSPDPHDGSLFLTYSDVIERLSCGKDCSIGGPPPAVPEPGSYALMLGGLGVLGAVLRRRQSGEARA